MRIDNFLFELDQATAAMVGLLGELYRAILSDAATLAWALGIAVLLAALLTVVGRWVRRQAPGGVLLGLRWPLCATVLLLVMVREPATVTTRIAVGAVALAAWIWAVVAVLSSAIGWLRRRAVAPWHELVASSPMEQLKQRLSAEICRAKRHADQVITVVALRRIDEPPLKSRRARDALHAALHDALRPYDAFAQDEDGTLYLLLPDTDAIAAQALVPRARLACATADPRQPSNDTYACGFASWPSSGNTAEDLLQAATEGMTVEGGSQPAWI